MTLYLILGVLGLLIGSFLNVCIWRIPRGESIVLPASHCPECSTPISAYDNIPVLSYLVLGGRCRHCKKPISLRYPAVEAANGLLYVYAFYWVGWGLHLPVYLAFISSLIVITLVDLDHQIIPDRITLTWIPIGILAGALILPDPFLRAEQLGWDGSLIGAAVGFGLFYAVAILSRGGMGGGDIKMMAMVGAVVGWRGVLLTTFLGSLVGSAVGIYLIVLKGKGRKAKVPFGPFLALGALISLLWGQEIINWYLNVRH